MTHKDQRLIVLLSACMLALGASSWSQRAGPPMRHTLIRGQVRDAETHQPLANVVVTLDHESSGFAAQTETDRDGKFTFDGPGEDAFLLRIRPIGYQELTYPVDLRTNTTDYVTLEPRRRTATSEVPASGAVDARQTAIPEKAREEFATAQKLFLDKKNFHGSLDHLQKAIKIYPDFADAYVLMAMVEAETNQPAEARDALQKATKVDPNSAAAYLALGMFENQAKEYDAAEKSLTRGLELNPEAPQGHYELAKTYWALGRWQEAEPHVEKALQLQPNMAPAHVLMGNIALRKHDSELALKEFKEYLRLDPQGPMAAGARQMADKLEQAAKTN